MNREVDDWISAAPQWAHCMESEYHLRGAVIRLCRFRVRDSSSIIGRLTQP